MVAVSAGRSTVNTGGAVSLASGEGTATTSGAVTIRSINAGETGVSGVLVFSSGAASQRQQRAPCIVALARRLTVAAA